MAEGYLSQEAVFTALAELAEGGEGWAGTVEIGNASGSVHQEHTWTALIAMWRDGLLERRFNNEKRHIEFRLATEVSPFKLGKDVSPPAEGAVHRVEPAEGSISSLPPVRAHVLYGVAQERLAQEDRGYDGTHDEAHGTRTWATLFAERAALFAHADTDHMREIRARQVAAVAVAYLETSAQRERGTQ